MGNLFSPAMQELFTLDKQDPVVTEARFKWFMGNLGCVDGLRKSELIAVPLNRAMPKGFTPDQSALQTQERKFQQALLSRFVDPLSDDEVPDKYKSIMSAVRELNQMNGASASVPLVHRIKHGVQYSIKLSLLCGHCHNDFTYLQDWSYDDHITEGGELLVFGGPWLVEESTTKNTKEQEELLAKLVTKFKLPFKLNHGSVSLDTLVVQSHELLTGEKHPLNNKWVRTSTTSSGGDRLLLWRDDDGCLRFDNWDWYDDGRYVFLGCLALGVVVLGH